MGKEWRRWTATNLSLQGLVGDLQRLKLRQDLREQSVVDEDLFWSRHGCCGRRRNRREEGERKGERRKENKSHPAQRSYTLEKRGGRGFGGSDLLFREHNTLITHGAHPPAECVPISGERAATAPYRRRSAGDGAAKRGAYKSFLAFLLETRGRR